VAASNKPRKNDGAIRASVRSAARLSAVQAIYQLDATSVPVNRIVTEFIQHRLSAPPEPIGGNPAGQEYFSEIVKGVAEERKALDTLIEGALAKGWSIERLDRVLHAILRCGAYEISMREDIPPRVAISEYVDIARAFFNGNEPGFVNGVLDSLARNQRADEMKARPGDAPAEPG